MTLRVLLQILRSRWISFLISAALVFGAVAAYTLLVPKVYTAKASLVVDPKVDPISGTLLAATVSPAYLMTQVDILQSTRVAARVVSDLKLTQIGELREKWIDTTKGSGDFAGWLADMLRNNLDVRPSRGSNVIDIAYNGSDPRFVETVANAFVAAYLDTTLELRTAPARDYSRFFDTSAKGLREKLEAAQARLSAFQQQAGIVVSDERLDVESQRLNELNSQLATLQGTAADTHSRNAEAQAMGDRSLDVTSNPLVASLRAELARQRAQLEQLRSRLGDSHPSVRELVLGIAENETRLEAETRRTQSGIGINDRVSQSRVAAARSALEEQRNKLLELRASRDQMAVLQRDVENAQHAYDGVLARLNQTNLESLNNQPGVSALEKATAPNYPSSPRIGLNLALGALVALIVGCITVGVREARDRRVRGDDDFEALVDLPLLAVVPSFRSGRFARLVSRDKPRPALPGSGRSAPA